MIHDIDIILSLVDSKVQHIEAFGQSTVSNHEDFANVRITFQNNTIADITSSRVTKEATRMIRICQKNSYILLDFMRCEAFLYENIDQDVKKSKLRINKKDALQVELQAFVSCVKSGKKTAGFRP